MVEWGGWEGGGTNQIRVGIEVDWGGTGGGNVTATVRYYVDVQGNWSDSQTLKLSGAISDTVNFSNNQNNNAVNRATRTKTYNYGNCEYGSSPGNWNFSVSLTGAYNGATPSKGVTKGIPGRSAGSPFKQENVTSSRVNDSNTKTTWRRDDRCSNPYKNQIVQRDIHLNDNWSNVAELGASATSFTDNDCIANRAYRYRVCATNGEGSSSWAGPGGYIYTTPGGCGNVQRSGLNGENQQITWNNNVNSSINHQIEIQRSANGGAWDTIATTGRDSTQYTDTYPAAHPAIKFKYRVRSKTNGGEQPTLYSDWSSATTETTGVTTPPNAPSNLAPTNDAIISPARTKVFTWKHNPTDQSAQTVFEIQWQVVGTGTWTPVAPVTSPTSSWTAPIGTFPDNSTIEWQVRTKGAHDDFGPWSATAQFKTVGDPNIIREQKRVMRLNLETGLPETAPVGVLPPIGSILMFGGATAPAGWLLCDGSVVSRETYEGLYGAIGPAFGAGDGSTTFNLPDLRGRFPLGAGITAPSESTRALGSTGGADQRTIATGNLPSHTHNAANLTTGTAGTHTHVLTMRASSGGTSTRVSSGTSGTPDSNSNAPVETSGTHEHNVTGETGGGGFANNPLATIGPYLGINFIIKT